MIPEKKLEESGLDQKRVISIANIIQSSGSNLAIRFKFSPLLNAENHETVGEMTPLNSVHIVTEVLKAQLIGID